MLSRGTPIDDVGAMALTKEEFSALARSLVHSDNPSHSAAADPSYRHGIPRYPTRALAARVTDRSGTTAMLAASGGRSIIPHHHTVALTIGLLVASSGAAAIAWTITNWKAYGETAGELIAQWTPSQLLASSVPPENGQVRWQPAPPPAEVSAANQVPPQEAPLQQAALQQVPPPQVASSTGLVGTGLAGTGLAGTGLAGQIDSDAVISAAAPVAPLPRVDFSQPLDPVAKELATANQEIQQLKTNQQQLFRDMTMVFDTLASIRSDKASAQLTRSNSLAQTPRPAPLRTRTREPDPPRPPMPVN
jgi:hypothetical protein